MKIQLQTMSSSKDDFKLPFKHPSSIVDYGKFEGKLHELDDEKG
jgi:hypothetical protein